MSGLQISNTFDIQNYQGIFYIYYYCIPNSDLLVCTSKDDQIFARGGNDNIFVRLGNNLIDRGERTIKVDW